MNRKMVLGIALMLMAIGLAYAQQYNAERDFEESAATIIGRVEIYGNEPHTFVGIVDENDIQYAVYPPDREAELRRLQGRLIDFTVIMLDEPRGEGGFYLKGGTVTPVKWEVIR